MARTDPRPTNSSSIARLRIERGLTQAQLAERIGCPQQTVTRWETGNNLPSTRYLMKIAAALDCEIKDLL